MPFPFGSSSANALNPADRVCERLAVLIGPNVARMAIRTYAKKTLNKEAEQITLADLPMLAQSLRPILRTMIGDARAETLIKELSV